MARLRLPTKNELAAIRATIEEAVARDDVADLHRLGVDARIDAGGRLCYTLAEAMSHQLKPEKDSQLDALALVAFLVQSMRQRPMRAWIKSAFQTIDHGIEKFKQTPNAPAITCRRGCNFCCYLAVAVTDPEVELIVDHLRGGRGWVDLQQLKQAVDLPRDPENFDKLQRSVRRCPFLKPDGYCGIYEVRPASCRNHNSVMAPALCDVDANPGATVAYAAHYVNGAVMSALSQLQSATGRLGNRVWHFMTEAERKTL